MEKSKCIPNSGWRNPRILIPREKPTHLNPQPAGELSLWNFQFTSVVLMWISLAHSALSRPLRVAIIRPCENICYWMVDSTVTASHIMPPWYRIFVPLYWGLSTVFSGFYNIIRNVNIITLKSNVQCRVQTERRNNFPANISIVTLVSAKVRQCWGFSELHRGSNSILEGNQHSATIFLKIAKIK